jgi:hypothetical protein
MEIGYYTGYDVSGIDYFGCLMWLTRLATSTFHTSWLRKPQGHNDELNNGKKKNLTTF